jgi:hypothetical protein
VINNPISLIGDMGLSLTGMRIGPLDPTTQKPKVGTKLEVVRPENSANQYKQEILKVINRVLKYIESFWFLRRFQDLGGVKKV